MEMQGTRVPVARSMRWSRALVALIASIAMVFGSVALAPAAAAGTRVTVVAPKIAGQQASFDAQLIGYINQARAAHGVGAVREATGLTIMSVWWSRQMSGGATNGALQHNPNAWTQVKTYGASNRRAWGENVGKISKGVSAKALFDAYMASPGHRANILSAKYRFIGMGTFGDSTTQFNTMEFTDQVESRTIIGSTTLVTKVAK